MATAALMETVKRGGSVQSSRTKKSNASELNPLLKSATKGK